MSPKRTLLIFDTRVDRRSWVSLVSPKAYIYHCGRAKSMELVQYKRSRDTSDITLTSDRAYSACQILCEKREREKEKVTNASKSSSFGVVKYTSSQFVVSFFEVAALRCHLGLPKGNRTALAFTPERLRFIALTEML